MGSCWSCGQSGNAAAFVNARSSVTNQRQEAPGTPGLRCTPGNVAALVVHGWAGYRPGDQICVDSSLIESYRSARLVA